MVAVVHCVKGFHRALNYNEQKVSEGAAVFLEGANCPKRAEELSFTQKLNLFKKLAALNEKTSVNCVHISLNFDPSEQFATGKLKAIAASYMDKLGFGEQPYFLYRHDDAGHPHVHIVTTNISQDGKRISLHNIGKTVSEKARKEVEKEFSLLRPEDSKNRQAYELKPVNAQKVNYGKSATKRAITTVLNKVLPEYKYTSLPELNAVLKQYNIVADRGVAESRIYQKGGLVYRVLDEQGNKIGVPVKASDIYNQPTLKSIENRYAANETYRQTHKTRVKNAVDWLLVKGSAPSLQTLTEGLKKQGIHAVIRQNENGVVYGITYVDHQTRCVYNGSDLGKQYSAKAIMERCGEQQPASVESKGLPPQRRQDWEAMRPKEVATNATAGDIAGSLLQEEYTGETMPFELRKKRKKKKRNISDNT